MKKMIKSKEYIWLRKFLRIIWPPIRILFSIGLLLKAVSGIEWSIFSSEKINMNFWWMLLAAASLLCANLFAGTRWACIMREAGFKGSVAGYINLVFAANLINQGLPSTLGGDSYRAIAGAHLESKGQFSQSNKIKEEVDELNDVDNAPPKIRVSIFLTFIDRLLGLSGNNILGGFGLILGGAVIADWCVNLGYVVLMSMFGFGFILSIAVNRSQSVYFIKKILTRIKIGAAFGAVKFAFGFPATLAQIGVSVWVHLLNVVALSCCFKVFNISVPWEALMIGLPALSLLLVLPISISGWGLREATLSSVLLLWGIDPSMTVLASVSYGALIVVCALPGAYTLLRIK